MTGISREVTTPLAIVGMACLFPKADGLSGYWANIRHGVDAIGPVPDSHWNPAEYFDADSKRPDFTYAQRGGFLSPVAFDPAAFGISPNNLEATDASQLLGLLVATQALRDAGYPPEGQWNRDKASVVLGVTGTLQLVVPLGARLGHPIWRKALKDAGIEGALAEQIVEDIADSYVGWQENSFPGLLGNVVAGRIANRLNLGGTNCVVDAACASSLSATHLAALELASGRSDVVVTGGVDTFNDIFMYMCFSKTPALSPSGDSRPFDADGDGTILGEGIGMVVLKRLDDAVRDGDRVYAVIKAVGSSSDGRGKAIYAPSAEGQTKALKNAYQLAGVGPDTIELLEGHGTGTKVGDATEVEALTQVYREAKSEGTWCALGSVKSQIGHTKAAAGAAGLIKAALALHHKVLPPTLKVSAPLPILASGDTPFYVNTMPRPWLPRTAHPRRAGVSAFGFGGSNFHAVLEEFRPEKTAPDWDGRVELIAISGATPAEIESKLAPYAAAPTWEALRVAAAADRSAFAVSAACRLIMVVEEGKTDLAALIANARAQLKEGRNAWQTPDGAFYGSGAPAGELGVLFPGQGAQYVGMGRDLSCVFPALLDAWQAVDPAFGPTAFGDRLSDRVYPAPAFGAEAQEAQSVRLRDTRAAQPAIGALSLGAYRVLEGFGLRPAGAAGHSYGELVALCVAGRMSVETLYRISCLRGRLMAEGEGDRGAMLAVQAPLAEVEAFVSRHGLPLVAANKNAPSQVVLSGASEAIARAEKLAAEDRLKAVRLPVSAAFHSPLVAAAAHPLREALAEASFTPGAFPVWANATAAPYPDAAEEARDLLAGQLARPVEFVAQIEAMYAAGIRTFLEVGPGGRLTGLVKAILDGRQVSAFAIDASNGRRDGVADLARALAQLAAIGYELDLAPWNGGEEAIAPIRDRKKPAMAVMLSGANYRTPKPAKPKRAVAAPVAQAPATRALNGHANGHHGPAPAPAPMPAALNGHANGNGNGHHPVPPSAPVAPVQAAAAPAPWMMEALKASQESLAALQKLQEQTAQLHRRFLEGQETTQQAFKNLIAQQQQVYQQALGEAPSPRQDRLDGVPGIPLPHRGEGNTAATPLNALNTPIIPTVPTPPTTPNIPVGIGIPGNHPNGVSPVPGGGEGSRQAVQAWRVGEGAPTPAPRTPAPVAPARAVEPVLLAVVSEKTGYPQEMLNVDMDLESDLGIDSIKRVEILSALQEQLSEAPAITPEHLGTLRTLRHIGEFLSAGMPQATATLAVPAASPAAAGVSSARVESVLLAVVAEKTGYPTEMLNLDMELESDLGIDSIKRVEILSALQERLPEAPAIKPEHLGTLRTLRQIIGFLSEGMPAAPSQPVAPSAQPAGASHVRVEGVLLAVVSEKTGYPQEMLNVDMDLESDLGIDSIKRVEILSALQEQLPEAPAITPEHLGSLRTLRHMIDHLAQGAATAIATPALPHSAPQGAPALEASRVEGVVLAVVADKTGYPAEMLNLDMEMESDLGIDSIKRVEIVSALQEALPDAPVVKPEHLGTLRTLRQMIAFLAGPGVTSAPVVAAVAGPAPIAPPPVGAPTEPESALPLIRQVLRAEQLTAARHEVRLSAGAEIWVADGGTPVADAVANRLYAMGFRARLLPLADAGAWPQAEQVAGLIVLAPIAEGLPNALWSEASERMLRNAFALVQRAGAGLRRQGGARLLTVSRLDGAFGLARLDGAAEVLSGGLAGLAKTCGHEWPEVACRALDVDRAWADSEAIAQAIVAELFLEGPVEVGLSAHGTTTLVLKDAPLDAVSAPAPFAEGDVVIVSGGARGVTAEVAVALAKACRPTLVLLGRSAPIDAEPAYLVGLTAEAEIKQALLAHAEAALTPKLLQERYAQIMAQREINQTLDRITAVGGEALYRAVDVRDAAAVASVIAGVRTSHGPIRGVLHGAGVLADRLILDQTAEQFDGVFDTKVRGLRSLLQATASDPLKAVVMFSSVTGRRGRTGQVAYAIANEVLNKTAQRLAVLRPETRAVAVNWGPWDGGMVTPALKKLFAEEGVGVVPLTEGAEYLVSELATSSTAVEVLVLGGLPGPAPAPEAPRARKLHPAFVRELDVADHPFLASHVINGKAVLPAAMMLEWMAHGALHANPGLNFHGFADFRVFRGVLLGGETYSIRVLAAAPVKRDGRLEVAVELRGADARDTLHASATMWLANRLPDAPQAPEAPAVAPYGRSVEAAYRDVLFHGVDFQGLRAIAGISEAGAIAEVAAAPAPSHWIASPLRDRWITDPLVLDAAFQMMILWSVQHAGAPCLPCHAASYRQYRAEFPAAGVSARAHVRSLKGNQAVIDFAFVDADGALVAELVGAESTLDANLVEPFRRNQLPAMVQP